MNIKKNFSTFSIIYILLLLLNSICFLPFLLMMPSLESLYSDFNAELPWITRIMLDLYRFFTDYWFIIIPVKLILLGLISLGLNVIVKKINVKSILLVMFLAIFVCLGLSFCSIYLPLYNLS